MIVIIIMIMIISFVYPRQYWFIALIGPSKCLKQIFQMKVNRVKNPNWPETNQLAIYDRGRGFDRDYREQIQLAVRVGLELGASELQVQRTNRSATLALPPYLDVMVIYNSVWDLWLKFWFLMKRIKNGAFSTAFKDAFILSLGRKLWTSIDLRLCSYSENKNGRSRFGEKLESVSFLPSEIFSIYSFFFQKILRPPPEKPPALPPAVYKWWVELEASFFGRTPLRLRS